MAADRWAMRPRVVAAVVVACAAQFLVGVDGLAVAIALPALQSDLGVPPIDGQWVLTTYGLAFGGSLVLGGRLGDLYGRRRALSAGMLLFVGGCVTAAAAPALPVVIVGRAVQGLGAAASVPAALAMIGSLFPHGRTRTRALTLLAAMTSVGVVTGLLIGGLLTDLAGWRSVFVATAPMALVAAFVAPRVLPETRSAEMQRPDVVGAVLVTSGLMGVLLGLTRIARHGLATAGTLVSLIGGLLMLAAFLAWTRHARQPLIRPRLFRVRSLRAATTGVGANAIAFTSIVYIGTLYFQLHLGYRPLRAGLALLPVDIVAFVVPLLSTRLVAHLSPRILLAPAFGVTLGALLWLARLPEPVSYVRDLLAPLICLGASLSIAFVVLTQEAVADVPDDENGAASGIFETANHLFGGAVGVALYATVLTTVGTDAGDAYGYRAAFFAAATVITVLGSSAVLQARSRTRDK